MKTKIILVILIISIFLIGAGCGKTVDKITGSKEKSAESEKEPGETKEPVKTDTPKENLPYAERIKKEFLDNINKVQSLSYRDYDTKNTYYVRGAQIKIQLFKPVLNPDRYDTVYLNNDELTAYIYCSKIGDCTYEQTKQYKKADYLKFRVKTPIDIAKSITRGELQELKTRQIEDAVVRPINYTDANGNKVTVWMHNYYAIPYEISTERPDGNMTLRRFVDISINQVTNADVNLPEGTVLVE